jgi:hypothetical protein
MEKSLMSHKIFGYKINLSKKILLLEVNTTINTIKK